MADNLASRPTTANSREGADNEAGYREPWTDDIPAAEQVPELSRAASAASDGEPWDQLSPMGGHAEFLPFDGMAQLNKPAAQWHAYKKLLHDPITDAVDISKSTAVASVDTLQTTPEHDQAHKLELMEDSMHPDHSKVSFRGHLLNTDTVRPVTIDTNLPSVPAPDDTLVYRALIVPKHRHHGLFQLPRDPNLEALGYEYEKSWLTRDQVWRVKDRAECKTLGVIRALEYVQHADIVHDFTKIHAELQAQDPRFDSSSATVLTQNETLPIYCMLDDRMTLDGVRALKQRLMGKQALFGDVWIESVGSSEIRNRIGGLTHARHLRTLAAQEEVITIEQPTQDMLVNHTDDPPLMCYGHHLNTDLQNPVIVVPDRPPVPAPDATTTNYIIVRVRKGMFGKAEKSQLRELDLRWDSKLDPRTDVYYYEADDLAQIRALPFVEHADIFHIHCKAVRSCYERYPWLDLTRERTFGPDEQALVEVGMTVVERGERKGWSATKPENLIARLLEDGLLMKVTYANWQYLCGKTLPEKFRDLAAIDEVRNIGTGEVQVHPAGLCGSSLADQGASLLSCPRLKYSHLSAQGQIISIADSGFNDGYRQRPHRAFLPVQRNIGFYYGASPSSVPREMHDLTGHGTFCLALAVGAHLRPHFRGVASDAKFIVSRIVDDNRRPVIKFSIDALTAPYNDGARVFTESCTWVLGSGSGLAGSTSPHSVDEFLRDRPDALVCWAAGNKVNSNQTNLVALQPCAKNVVTVGSCRAETGNVVSEFSRCGDPGGQFKPDVVAPGENIVSAKSRAITADKLKDYQAFPLNQSLMCGRGTSFSTPQVAGCAAVLRETVISQGFLTNPSAPLLKAMIVNGAIPLSDQPESLPRHDYGFGRVDLTRSLTHVTAGQLGEYDIDNNAACPKPVAIRVPCSGTHTLYVTLTWNDCPNSVGDLSHLLYLKVSAVFDDKCYTRLGNKAADDDTPDTVNNVQRVIWTDIPEGEIQLCIERLSSPCEWSGCKGVKAALVWLVERTEQDHGQPGDKP